MMHLTPRSLGLLSEKTDLTHAALYAAAQTGLDLPITDYQTIRDLLQISRGNTAGTFKSDGVFRVTSLYLRIS